MFGNRGTIGTNGDESNKNSNVQISNNTTKSNYCAIQYKAMTIYEIKSTRYEMYVFTCKRKIKPILKKKLI